MLKQIWSSDCPEERRSHGELGVILNTEWLFRFVDLDKDVDGKNRMKTSRLMTEEFMKTDGWSFYRVAHVADILRALEVHAAQKGGGRRFGYVLIKAAVIRKIRDDAQRRAICVIDNPESGDPKPLDPSIAPAHALAHRAREYTKDEAREIRDKLLAEFSDVIKAK